MTTCAGKSEARLIMAEKLAAMAMAFDRLTRRTRAAPAAATLSRTRI
jgi:hypothetical protein